MTITLAPGETVTRRVLPRAGGLAVEGYPVGAVTVDDPGVATVARVNDVPGTVTLTGVAEGTTTVRAALRGRALPALAEPVVVALPPSGLLPELAALAADLVALGRTVDALYYPGQPGSVGLSAGRAASLADARGASGYAPTITMDPGPPTDWQNAPRTPELPSVETIAGEGTVVRFNTYNWGTTPRVPLFALNTDHVWYFLGAWPSPAFNQTAGVDAQVLGGPTGIEDVCDFMSHDPTAQGDYLTRGNGGQSGPYYMTGRSIVASEAVRLVLVGSDVRALGGAPERARLSGMADVATNGVPADYAGGDARFTMNQDYNVAATGDSTVKHAHGRWALALRVSGAESAAVTARVRTFAETYHPAVRAVGNTNLQEVPPAEVDLLVALGAAVPTNLVDGHAPASVGGLWVPALDYAKSYGDTYATRLVSMLADVRGSDVNGWARFLVQSFDASLRPAYDATTGRLLFSGSAALTTWEPPAVPPTGDPVMTGTMTLVYGGVRPGGAAVLGTLDLTGLTSVTLSAATLGGALELAFAFWVRESAAAFNASHRSAAIDYALAAHGLVVT